MKSQPLRRLARAASDRSFLLGGVVVGLLLLVAALGPEVAPHNPYLRQRIHWIDGELHRAPIDPGPEFPLGTDAEGRDVLSLLLHGARTTFVIALIATAARLVAGFLLGSLAGWWRHGPLDRAVAKLTEFLSALPGIILAILIVYAVGIRKGQIAFIAAVGIVGLGQVAQTVRSSVLSLKEQEFVEGARAIGLGSLQILSRHVLPNMIGTLLALSVLQMGSSLLLLGELGFLQIFIGSGSFILGDAGTPSQLIFETPDWGAMLGSTWRYFKSKPWLPGAPAAAFLVATLAFNVFGYGLQRFMDRGRYYPSGWSVLRILIVVGLLLGGAQLLISQTGPEAQFREQSMSFDETRAWSDVAFLTRRDLLGSSPGSEASRLAASYIARSFAEAELTPFPGGGYFQPFQAMHGRITTLPKVEVLDGEGSPGYSLDMGLAYDPLAPFRATGVMEGELLIYGNIRPQSFNQTGGLTLLFDTGEIIPALVLRVVPDGALPSSLRAPLFNGPASFLTDRVGMLIGESAARQLLRELDVDLDRLRQTLAAEQEVLVSTGARARVTYGLDYEVAAEVNVVGYWPGVDPRTMTQRILVAAPFTVPAAVDGQLFPGADENASGVAVMLEVLRQWREQEFQPRSTVVFAAFDELGGQHFVQDPILPTGASDSWTAVVVYGVGSGEETLARRSSGGSLASLFDRSARRMGARPAGLEDWRFFFSGGGGRGWGQPADPAYSGLVLTREGDLYSGTGLDTRGHVDPELMREAGQVLSHFLMVLSSR